MTTVRGVTPCLAVADIAAARDFLETCLGFETQASFDGFAYCVRDAGAVRLVQAPPGHPEPPEASGFMVYIDVDDADALWATHADAIATLPESHRQPPTDQPYGQREFLIQHGPFAFVVAHPIERTPSA